MDQKPLNLAIVGCGNIAASYAKTLQPYSQLKLLGATSRTLKRAEDFVATFGGKVYPSLEAILADDEVDLVINLTIHHAHVEVITKCLNAGKDVYSEKPIALTSEEHPAPGPFYEVGPLFDVGVYPLTILTTIFGPARRVTAFGKVLYADRVTQEGVPFHITTPDFSIAAIEFANGAVARLTTNFYVGFHSKQPGIEFHGDKGSLFLSNWHDFNGTVEYADFGGTYEPLPYVKEPYAGNVKEDPHAGVEWSRGVLDMADAMKENRPQRITGAQAAHVIDIVCGIQAAFREGCRVEVTSEFPQPAPMEWAK